MCVGWFGTRLHARSLCLLYQGPRRSLFPNPACGLSAPSSHAPSLSPLIRPRFYLPCCRMIRIKPNLLLVQARTINDLHLVSLATLLSAGPTVPSMSLRLRLTSKILTYETERGIITSLQYFDGDPQYSGFVVAWRLGCRGVVVCVGDASGGFVGARGLEGARKACIRGELVQVAGSASVA